MRRRSRRQFLTEVAAAGAAAGAWWGFPAAVRGDEKEVVSSASPVQPAWPTQSPELAREMVGVSHGNLKRVEELLERHATLANAAWDWGFGDWETALGAASHTGNRPIASLLLGKGARPTLFSAAMLGHVEVVRALVTATPGIQGTAGPHGLSLLHHARAGGERAAEVVRFLESLGGADPSLDPVPLDAAQEAAIVGSYRFGAGDTERIEIAQGRAGLLFERAGRSPLRLHHRGDLAFSPAGAPRVRVRFTLDGPRAVALSVDDPVESLQAIRI